MQRRTFLTKASGAIAGVAIATGLTSAKRGRHELPNDNVPHTEVRPFEALSPQRVQTGEWILHEVAWTGRTEERLEEFIGTFDTRAWIDGEPVADPMSYWDFEIQEDPDLTDRPFVEWRYVTPPKSPGEYDFEVEFEITEDIHDFNEGDIVRTSGTYVVSSER